MHTHSYLHRQRSLAGKSWLPAAALAIAALPLHGQIGLGLTPMRVEFPAAAGKAYSGTLSLSNSSDRKVRVRAELLEFYVDQNQTPQFTPVAPSEAEYSCRSWLSVNPMEAEVEPRSQLRVRYTARAPSDARERGYHCAIGLTSLPAVDEQAGIGVRTAVRVVAVLYPVVGKPAFDGEITALSLEAVAAGPQSTWRGVVVMENAGLVVYRPSGKLDVVDASGKLVESLEIASFPVLPRRRQRFLLPLKHGLPPGRYTLHARIDLGSEVQEASEQVSVEAQRR